MIAKRVLISSSVPTEFWVYAMKYAAMVRNIVGVKVHGRIQFPYHMLLGRGVDIKHLHPFGCRAFMSRTQIAKNLNTQEPAKRPDWKLSRFPVWFIGYDNICLQPKKYVVVLSNAVFDRKGTIKAHIKSTSELIFVIVNRRVSVMTSTGAFHRCLPVRYQGSFNAVINAVHNR